MPLSVSDVRERVAAAVLAISSPAGWRESPMPPGMGPADPGRFAHLAFSVWVPSTDFAAPGDSSRIQRGAPGGLVRTNLRIRWTYRLRADNAVADYDSALDAEATAVKAVTGVSALGGLHIAIVGTAREVVGDGTWLLCEINATATHQIAIQ
jgi:hypothetical protein